jgi:hypothetical protein
MIYPPGQGKFGRYLMSLWRDYLEHYADKDGNAEDQSIIGAYYSVEVLVAFSRTLDRNDCYKQLIDQRYSIFREGSKQAETFLDCLLNATFSIYNSLNTLSHQFTEGNESAVSLIHKVDEQVRQGAESGLQIDRSSSALRGSFALISLIAITLNQSEPVTRSIRQVEQRFVSAANAAATDWDQLLNPLYRIVEMMQILVLLTDAELMDQINQIASRFQEEDQEKGLPLKIRNGFCRLFELAHLMITHVDSIV